MMKYSQAAMLYAVFRCLEKPDCRMIIALPRFKWDDAFNEYEKCMKAMDALGFFNPDECKVRRNNNYIEIYFNTTGSMIKFVSPGNHARGNKCHLVIYDTSIDKETRDLILRPMEVMR